MLNFIPRKTSRRALALITSTTLMTAASMVAAPAYAGNTNGVSVQINKAELVSEVGVKRTYYRLKTAANTACQANEGLTDIKRRVAADACVDNLMESFLEQVKSERLMAFHSEELIKAG